MENEQRDKIWEKSFETYYDSYFQELVAGKLVYRWSLFDEITKVLVAITATGSAVAGWSLWNKPDFKNAWIILAALGAILSIVHAALNVQSKLKEWEEINRLFTSLRVELESFRQKIEIHPDFDVKEFVEKYDKSREKYGEVMCRLRHDLMRTREFEKKIQKELDQQISDQTRN